jgi:lantibiotic modifying enzyme
MTVPVRTAAFADEELSIAVAIADRLTAEAIWSGDRCNWVGAEPMDLREPVLTYRALGPGLYAGSSGVALFLAEMSAATGWHAYRATALAAMRHAMSRRDDVAPAGRAGLYTGWAGLAAAAVRTGLLLDAAELVDAGTGLLHDVGGLVGPGRPDEAEFDLMSGAAGAVPALAFGHRFTGDDAMAEAAVTAAEWLLSSARRGRTGWSWRSPGLRNQHDLTGLSHGAAGVAVAFVEAYGLSGDERFAAGAGNAMLYENGWLDPEKGNWPDFRENPAGGRTYVTLWCHGAPGIALSRLHAYERLGETRWREDAMLALATTARETRRLADGGGTDFSLCHGLAGNAESFQEARRVLGTESDVPALVAGHGRERYARTGAAWPCGTHTEETPNLMLGLAGIGHFYLRLATPQVPSVLLPVSWDG